MKNQEPGLNTANQTKPKLIGKSEIMRVKDPKPAKPHKKTGPKGPTKYKKRFVLALTEKLLAFAQAKIEAGKPIFLQEFCWQNKIPSDVLYRIAEKRLVKLKAKKFIRAYKLVKDLQEADLAEGATTGRYESGFAFRALKNVAGWRDEQHVKSEHTERKVILIRDDRASREETSLLSR